MPFLRLTRDRRGFENTYLLHADRPGDKPRLLYWYRTAPGIEQGRPPLDEDAIRTIEDTHPDIDFDWPAILALSEVMTPEEEAPAPRPQKQQGRRPGQGDGQRRRSGGESRREDRPQQSVVAPVDDSHDTRAADDSTDATAERVEEPRAPWYAEPAAPVRTGGLLEELVGREISTRLRARYAEIAGRIREQNVDEGVRAGWLKRAEAMNPDTWTTPDAILDGVRNADTLFDKLRSEIS